MESKWKLTVYRTIRARGESRHVTEIRIYDDKPTADRVAKNLIEEDKAHFVIGPERIAS